jgi:hypothetical protein
MPSFLQEAVSFDTRSKERGKCDRERKKLIKDFEKEK